MDDLAERIADSRPEVTDLTPLDVDRMVRRGRRQRVAGMAGGAAALALVVAGAGITAAGMSNAPPRPQVATAPPTEVPQPDATWSTLEVPIAPRLSPLVGQTTTGQVVVFGGSRLDGGPADGAVIDPDSGQSHQIPPMPGRTPSFEGGAFAWMMFEQDRVVVLSSAADGGVGGAWYDLETGDWSQIPSTDRIVGHAEVVGFDGSVVSLVQTGFRDGEPTSPHVARYDLDAGAWGEGATPPFSNRSAPAVASQDGQVLVHGGKLTAEEIEADTPIDGGDDATATQSERTFRYDTTADSWTELDPAPLESGVWRSAVWLDRSRVAVVSSGQEEMIGPGTGVSEHHAAAVYDTSTGTWTRVAPPEELVPNARITYRGHGDSRTERSVLTATDATGETAASAIYDVASGRWMPGPPVDPTHVEAAGATYVAISGRPRDVPTMGAHVQTPGHGWLAVDGAAPAARNAASTIAVGSRVLLVGGEEADGPADSIAVLDTAP